MLEGIRPVAEQPPKSLKLGLEQVFKRLYPENSQT